MQEKKKRENSFIQFTGKSYSMVEGHSFGKREEKKLIKKEKGGGHQGQTEPQKPQKRFHHRSHYLGRGGSYRKNNISCQTRTRSRSKKGRVKSALKKVQPENQKESGFGNKRKGASKHNEDDPKLTYRKISGNASNPTGNPLSPPPPKIVPKQKDY